MQTLAEVVRRKSKELSEKMAEDIAAMKDSKWNLVRQAGSIPRCKKQIL